MKGRSIILAGGSGGLGAAVAEALAARGAVPVIGCRENRERAQVVAKRLLDVHGVEAPIVAGDILVDSVRQELIEKARRAGTVYGLVSLTGVPARVPVETATEQDLTDSYRANFVGPVLLARDFNAAVAGADASIVFIATMQGAAVFAGSTTYAAPKAALIHTARILARQWKTRVNVVAPGVNDAGMAESSVRTGKYDRFVESGAIPRFGRPADIARAVTFFLEPDNYITGQTLVVDGGLTTKM